ncbi:cytochrome P450 [Nocardia sp. CS682]|uniref:cytochrome P450 n=1 Tax=Nocardia sp. CS682 TaxID=1047172 RepID=UPI00107581D3|nr:hypothetical protein DMB37_27900 [Nocardia sp. CS682]
MSKAFTPRVVQQLAPRITEIVDDILDKHSAAGAFDAVTAFAYPLQVTVICELLGVPLEDEARLSHWSALLARTLDPTSKQATEFRADPAEIQRAGTELSGYFEQLIERRRATPGPWSSAQRLVSRCRTCAASMRRAGGPRRRAVPRRLGPW